MLIKDVRVLVGGALLAMFVQGCSSPPKQPEGAELAYSGQAPTYATPEDAVVALISAASKGDAAAAAAALGPGIEELAAETPERTAGDLQRLASAYARGHELVQEADGTVTLMVDVGSQRWTFPIALIQAEGRWSFDVASGVQNVIDLRIARNETDAIRFLLAMIDVQKSYYELKLGPGGASTYAAKFLSRPGQRDGLYWPEDLGPPATPMGPIVEAAQAAGYDTKINPDLPRPFLGYWYRILSFQSENAPGGAQNYLDESGAMTGGFAFLAWPEQYGRTGVKSFLVSSDGQVWQRDLGEETAALLREFDGLDPGAGWERTTDF